MAEYIDKQVVLNTLCKAGCGSEYCGIPCEEALAISRLASADVAEVVRCGECKHSYESVAGLICSYGVCVDCLVSDDFYCSNGERKDVRGIQNRGDNHV